MAKVAINLRILKHQPPKNVIKTCKNFSGLKICNVLQVHTQHYGRNVNDHKSLSYKYTQIKQVIFSKEVKCSALILKDTTLSKTQHWIKDFTLSKRPNVG